MSDYYEEIQALNELRAPFVSVTLVDARGSVPQDAGAKMLVTLEGLDSGTIGGGKVEKKAIEEALLMLSGGSREKTRFMEWRLDQDVGMTCGGLVRLYFEVFNLSTWEVVVFGAGHISNCLVRMLLTLDCRVTCIDPRAEWLEKLPENPKLSKKLVLEMPGEVETLPEDSFVLLVTMGHTTDKPILLEILRTRQFPYLGVIGSRAKAARLRHDIEEAGLPESAKQAFYCPMGLDIGTNDPPEIAISIVAQLIQVRDQVFATRQGAIPVSS